MTPEHHVLTITRLDQSGISVVSANHPGEFSLELCPPASEEGSLVGFARMVTGAVCAALSVTAPLPELPDPHPDEFGRPRFFVSLDGRGGVSVLWPSSGEFAKTLVKGGQARDGSGRVEQIDLAAHIIASAFLPVDAPSVYIPGCFGSCIPNPDALYLELAAFELPITVTPV